MHKIISRMMFAFVAVAMFAGVAQAATIIDKDGFKYTIKGDWQIQLRQDPGVDQELEVEYDDLELKNKVTYKISDSLTAFGALDYGFKNDADDKSSDANPHVEEAYLGLDFGTVDFLVGKTDSAADEFGVEAAYEEIIAEDLFDLRGTLDGDDMIMANIRLENVHIAVAHELSSESEDSGNEEFTDICVTAGFGDLEVAAAYQVYEDDVLVPTTDMTIYGVSASYDTKVVKVGVDYSVAEDDLAPLADSSMINAVVTVPFDKKTKANLGYVMLEWDDLSALDVDAWYANVTHKLHKNFHIFAEVTDSDVDNTDAGYLAGMRLKF